MGVMFTWKVGHKIDVQIYENKYLQYVHLKSWTQNWCSNLWRQIPTICHLWKPTCWNESKLFKTQAWEWMLLAGAGRNRSSCGFSLLNVTEASIQFIAMNSFGNGEEFRCPFSLVCRMCCAGLFMALSEIYLSCPDFCDVFLYNLRILHISIFGRRHWYLLFDPGRRTSSDSCYTV